MSANTKDRRKERIEARAFLKAAGKQAEIAALMDRAERVEERAKELKGNTADELFALGKSLRAMAREMEQNSVKARRAIETLSGMEYEVVRARYAEGKSWGEVVQKMHNTREGLAYYERAAVDRLIETRAIRETNDKPRGKHREKNKK